MTARIINLRTRRKQKARDAAKAGADANAAKHGLSRGARQQDEAERAREARHLDGLASDEVLMTPQGPNVFDALGKMALLGRCYLFMDAGDPVVDRVARL